MHSKLCRTAAKRPPVCQALYFIRMSDLKKYIVIVSATIISVIFVYIFYAIYLLIDLDNRRARVEANLEIWMKNKPEAYSYTVKEGCMLSREYQVIHKRGEDLFFSVRKYCDPNEGAKCESEMESIDGIFNKLIDASIKAEVLDIEYGKFRYPEKVDIDWSRKAIDDECYIFIEDFRKI